MEIWEREERQGSEACTVYTRKNDFTTINCPRLLFSSVIVVIAKLSWFYR